VPVNVLTSDFNHMEARLSRRYEWIVLLFAAVVFLTGVISPPSLMDDVDASQAQMARNMLLSGDWVTARLDGVLYIEKAPFKYWATAVCYLIFGVYDWVARLPSALSAIVLCWLLVRIGRWAGSPKAGLFAGLFLATCVGLFLFTRIVIPDVILTLSMTVSMWAFLRALDEDERHPRAWAYVLAASLAAGLLIKGLIGMVFPLGAGFLYLLFTRRLFDVKSWRRLYPFTSVLIFLAVAAPWHVLATLRNPPYLDFTLHSTPFRWRGFFWFYFINEQLLRFLNERYPRDYNTVPRLYFWGLHLAWLFPWSVYLPQLRRLNYRPIGREGRLHVLALCWIGFVMVFFTFSTTQEYYSMPIYPAVALLLGSAVAASGSVRVGARVISVIAASAAVAIAAILIMSRGVATPGDISNALTQNPDAYTLSLGHMQDLTLRSFAYLRLPLVIAGIACLAGAVGAWKLRGEAAVFAIAGMMALFFQAARLALVVFDPYLSSRPLATALARSPKGTLIVSGEYYGFSSLFFYTEDHCLMLNGRYFNLEYGSYAPGAPQVFIDNGDFARLWLEPRRFYLAVFDEKVADIQKLVGRDHLHLIAAVGGKSLYTNQDLAPAGAAQTIRGFSRAAGGG
jgi:4-amino-4-deoxy-L-arabinose transferase-like glycosyltransferase